MHSTTSGFGIHNPITGGQITLPLLEGMIHRLPRQSLEQLACTLIDQLDELETDPDLELSGDEYDGTDAEDDFGFFARPSLFAGPGCSISDPN